MVKQIPAKVTKVFRKVQKSKAEIIVNEGGAGSTKSYSLCQFLIFKLLKTPKRKSLILRKIRHSLKLSTYRMFIGLLKLYDVYNERCHNKSDLNYTFSNGAFVQFLGMDDRQKIKSTEWDDIWMEEANEFEKEDLWFLKTRRNRTGNESQIHLSYNPEECWIQSLEGKKDTEFIFSNYKDNPYASKQYKDTLESLKDEDDAYYKIYALGKRAQRGNLIYTPYILEDAFPEGFEDEYYGLDFGFNSPCGLIKLNSETLDINEKDIYLTELLYQTKLTTPELIDLMKDLILSDKRDKPIYADSEDPNAIKQIYDAGFNIIPAEKGKGSVREGIIFSKHYKYHTLNTNVNLNKERSSYKWKTDKNGNIIDEPVKFRDHLMTAKRYAIYMHRGIKQGNPTSIKDALRNIQNAEESESLAIGEGVYLT